MRENKVIYDDILYKLSSNISDKIYDAPEIFIPILTEILSSITTDKKIVEKIADGLSVMDKSATIQKDKKGRILYDKESKDIELVPFDEDIDTYMQREVWPYIPDAVAFFEEKLDVKKPVIKTGAEISFTRYFYK